MSRITLGLAAAATAIGLTGASPAVAAVNLSTLVQWKVEDGGNGHYYALTDTVATWTDTYAMAMAGGGDLASIASEAENDFLGNAFNFGTTTDSIYWIGLRRLTEGGAFAWTDGSALSYTNWHPGEPNNADPGERYTAINWYAGNGQSNTLGDWNDTPNAGVLYANPTAQPNRGIVEFTSNPLAAVPEPTSWALMIAGFGLAGATLRRRRTACS